MGMKVYQMASCLKTMGLGDTTRALCLRTFKEKGHDKAMEQANQILAKRSRDLETARQIAHKYLATRDPHGGPLRKQR